MDYLKLFQNHSEYEAFVSGGTMLKPNVSHCIQENEVHYNPIHDPYNGHAYVDLGLPSGTIWATMNVGATAPEEHGLYFAWAEKDGYMGVTSEKGFYQDDYQYGDGIWKFTKYCPTSASTYLADGFTGDTLTIVENSDDGVQSEWGGGWHMPTYEQLIELTVNTTTAWTQINGVSGMTFTAQNGNSMFIPAGGMISEGVIENVGVVCSLWSASLITSNPVRAWEFDVANEGYWVNDEVARCCGLNLRGVVG